MLFDEYDEITQDLLTQRIVERISSGQPCEIEIYLYTKVRIVFDASAPENNYCRSLNDAEEVGTPLQNHIWNVLIRNRMSPVVLTGDIRQAFFSNTHPRTQQKCTSFSLDKN